MSSATALMTTEEFLALPEDGVERWLMNGELREASRTMPTRNRFYSRAMTCVATELELWLRQQPEPRGQILTGDACVWLRKDPDTLFGIDVAYFTAEVMARQGANITLVEGVPELSVVILSPSDTMEDVNEKIDAYLSFGVPLVWVLDPHRRTVTVHRPGQDPELVSGRQELTADRLPGFRLLAGKLFG